MFHTSLEDIIRRLFICLLVCSSHYSVAQDVVKIVVDPNGVQTGECKLSDLAESIEYIPLETNDKCLIGYVLFFDISENYIVIYCNKSKLIYLFHRTGRFICQVGEYGEGSREYLHVDGLFIDEKKKRIIVISATAKKQLNYDLNGNFISSIEIKDKGSCMRLHNNRFLVKTNNYNGNVPFAYEIRDMNLQLVAEAVKTVPFERGRLTMLHGRPCNYLYNNKIHVKELTFNDTVYLIGEDNFFEPKYVINTGKYEVTADLYRIDDPSEMFDQLDKHASIRNIYETKDKLFVYYLYENSDVYCYHDKNTQKLLHFKSNKGIPNDYDGGLDFWPERQDNQYWYAFYDAHLFEDELKEKKKETLKGGVNAIRLFDQFRKKLDSDDNPVLVIVKTKK